MSSNAINSRKAKEDLLAMANHSLQWEHQVNKLTVQSTLLEVTPLGQLSPVWKRLMFGLPAGHLSFLATASIDCLPTPTSLARWNMKVIPTMPAIVLHVQAHPQLLQNSTEPRTIHLVTRPSSADHCRVHQAPQSKWLYLL